MQIDLDALGSSVVDLASHVAAQDGPIAIQPHEARVLEGGQDGSEASRIDEHVQVVIRPAAVAAIQELNGDGTLDNGPWHVRRIEDGRQSRQLPDRPQVPVDRVLPVQACGFAQVRRRIGPAVNAWTDEAKHPMEAPEGDEGTLISCDRGEQIMIAERIRSPMLAQACAKEGDWSLRPPPSDPVP